MAATTARTLKLGEARELIRKLHPCSEEFAVYQEMDAGLPAFEVWASAHPADRQWVINALHPQLNLPCESGYQMASRKATLARHAAVDAARAVWKAGREATLELPSAVERCERQYALEGDFDRAVAASWEAFNVRVQEIEAERDACQARRSTYNAVVRALLRY